MQTVEDDDGARYLLLKRSDESSLVRDPETGAERYVGTDDLSPVEGVSALETAAREVDEPIRRLLSAVHDDRTLGLLLVLDARGPLAVRELLAFDTLCESDFHGTVAELRAAGLLEECEIAGERGYGTTQLAAEALSSLRGSGGE
ncbi:DUF7346 family protein [Halalkalicoccus jeotgali]|uniref:Uncharacterized protein n=1 Tax=Halalkalicoccus jeotgali (strain DSM 18796 / CECT 7217 / JCM 14584 / KCTC 4019 / B3) TaxID=795797 RepID=D8J6A1_HALJB|nr:hypothetical protein [Halalkalicoccus jeotgali]ADJ15819.1 hypothetical protein HacjB3_12180 [Halalkalicoccus jeotgali B3]ELY38282.1 hypothetical protein C497_07339 [Halalkalicoccus jeotgali B3]